MMKTIKTVRSTTSVGLTVTAILALVILSPAANAKERFLVIYKDKVSFSAAAKMTSKNRLSFSKFSSNQSQNTLIQANAEVEQAMPAINTLVVSAEGADSFEKLTQDSRVAYVEKEYIHEAPAPVRGAVHPAKPTTRFKVKSGTPWGIAAVKAPQAWELAGHGENARVLVLDTGIDANHPALKNNFEAGKDFTGDSDGSDFSDLQGHGTHVAGTIAGSMMQSGFVGVAPLAKILMGRVCSNQGCSNIAIAQGINWGIENKVDVISMSLGGAWSTPAERDAIAKADVSGISVVAASGNDGTGRVSYPAALSSVIAVGAVDINLNKATFSQFGPELDIVAPGVSVESSVPQGTGRSSSVIVSVNGVYEVVKSTSFLGAREVTAGESNYLVNCGLGKATDFAGKDVKGKYALVQRGEIKFTEKIENAIKAGATGVIFFNNAPGLIQGALTEDGSTLPVAAFMVEQSVGQALVKASNEKKQIAARVQTVVTDYSNFDGTSMATPHVAGVVALMKSANKTLKPSDVRVLLGKTSTVLAPNEQNQLGSGLVNAEAAVSASLEAAR